MNTALVLLGDQTFSQRWLVDGNIVSWADKMQTGGDAHATVRLACLYSTIGLLTTSLNSAPR